ncbi:MAG: hypothetical protein GX444_12725 [Myxococcales bacterium]|nr:hypothetical protein [Myxococcales bacterium]
MKLTVVGAGGIRMPLFVRSLIRRIKKGADIATLAMTDIRPERLEIMGRLARYLIEQAELPLRVEIETDLDRALPGSDAVVTTIRPGFEDGRIADELICARAGSLGQETVGAAGFAMAARSIVDLTAIAARARALAPQAMILNFTNPSGICTQALHDAGFHQVIGICDSADNVKEYVAISRGVEPERIRLRVFGLNHLSATMQVWIDDRDVTRELMADDEFIDKWFGIFGRDLVRRLGAFPNEYLFYYLLPERARQSVLAEKETRGQKVKRITDRFFAGAKDPSLANQPARLLELHAACMADRSNSYMEYAWKDTDAKQRPDHSLAEGEGYAGVALDVLEAKWRRPTELAISHPNRGAIPWLSDSDVIEVTCRVDAAGVTPLAPPAIPDRLAPLVRQVKIFETLTVLAVRHRNRQTAKWALATHPLIGDAAVIDRIYEEFARAHPETIGAYR